MSKTYRLHYTTEFFDDLRDIYSYIAYHFREKRTAQNQVGRIKAEIKELRKSIASRVCSDYYGKPVEYRM